MNVSKTIIAAVLTVLAVLPCAAQKQALAGELAKLRVVRNELNPKNDNSAFDAQFADIERDLAAGRLHAALYKLQSLWIGVASFSFDESRSAVVQDKLPLLEAEWKKVGEELAAKEEKFSSQQIDTLPALSRAVIEASRHRSRPLYQSSILYAKNTNPNQGLYYMGNARAGIDLALFARDLRFEPRKTALKSASLETELARIEREIIEAYRKSTPDDQNRYNALNASLKLAQELNERGWYDGAALKYFDVLLAFGLLKNPRVEPARNSALKAALNEQLTVLGKSEFDHSIGLVYLEIAAGLLAADTVSDADLKRANVIVSEVLPEYTRIFNRGNN